MVIPYLKSMLKKSKRLTAATLKRPTTRQEWQPAGARPGHGPLLAETTTLGAHITPRGRSDGHLGRVRHHGVSRGVLVIQLACTAGCILPLQAMC